MHYKNGREAKVGDQVIGVTYNVKRIVAGTLLSITPGPDNCSAKVGYTELKLISEIEAQGYISTGDFSVKVQGTQNHGAKGELAVLNYKEDYTHCANLLHADDANSLYTVAQADKAAE